MLFKAKKGLTLIETIMAAAVFTMALAGLITALISCLYIIQTSKDATVAAADLTNLMEKIRATPFDYITNRFPNAVVDGPAANPYSGLFQGYTLSNEHITVSYADIYADPLEMLVKLEWQDQRGRAHNISMATFRTR